MPKMSPDTINILKMWIGNTPPINIINNKTNVLLNNTTPNTPNNTPNNTTPNLSPILNKIKISPNTNLYLKTLISKTPPTSIFEIKRKNSFNDFKL